MTAYEGPNAEQIRFWNEVSGPQWVELDDILSAQLRPLGLRALERLDVRPGERILDIGCGGGDTTAEIARRVGASGRAVGVDISEPLAAHARKATAGLPHVEIRVADAQTTELESESFDALFSRFGVMFFADPEAAFANLRRALRPGGRLTFICWRALIENPWAMLPAMAAAQHVPITRPEPHAPGPFAFADGDRVQGILERAGFVHVQRKPVDESMVVARGQALDGAVELLLRIGPASRALREANAGPDVVDAVRASVREAIARYETSDGVAMPAACWLVTAQRGDG